MQLQLLECCSMAVSAAVRWRQPGLVMQLSATEDSGGYVAGDNSTNVSSRVNLSEAKDLAKFERASEPAKSLGPSQTGGAFVARDDG